jgi:hypothetical protein
MNFSSPVKKPKILWAFLFLTFSSQAAFADFYSEQVEPVKTRAFDSGSQRLLAAAAGSLFLAQSLDGSTRDQWKDHQTMSVETADYGDHFAKYAVGPVIALGQLYWDHDNGVAHARALIYTGAVTQILKESIHRKRPNGSDNVSMPSGHTSTAFATATALTYSYGWKAGIIMYPVATFVGMSRMADDMHWLSDAVAGAFIGVWLGRASSYSADHPPSATESHLQCVPIFQARYLGLNLQFEF